MCPLVPLVACLGLAFAPVPFRARGDGGFEVTFTGTKDASGGYGPLAYEAMRPGWKAEVRDGRLRLRGDHDEGNQRMVVTSQKALGKAQWPDALDVMARLGGGGEFGGAWHVGVSVGRVKVLFHPAFDGGAFRVEDV